MKEKTAEQVWSGCLQIIKDNVSPQNFKTWFEPIKPVRLVGEVITIQVPNKFFYEWLEEHYVDILKKAIKKELGYNGRLEYQIMVENHRKIGSNKLAEVPPVAITESPDAKFLNPFVIPGIQKIKIESQLNENYKFSTFIMGDCNKFPGSAGVAIAKKPGGTAFNPLVIYGGVGLGKTHLAHAIGNEIKEQYIEKQVLYVTTEKFTNQVIQAIKSNSVNDFFNFYQMIDVLIIDDIQFLSNRPKTQEIFFNIFNQLHQTGKLKRLSFPNI